MASGDGKRLMPTGAGSGLSTSRFFNSPFAMSAPMEHQVHHLEKYRGGAGKLPQSREPSWTVLNINSRSASRLHLLSTATRLRMKVHRYIFRTQHSKMFRPRFIHV
jgi:hypothetical protein